MSPRQCVARAIARGNPRVVGTPSGDSPYGAPVAPINQLRGRWRKRMNSRGLSLPGSWSRYMDPTCKCRPRRDHTADGRGGSAPPLPLATIKCATDCKPSPLMGRVGWG